MPAPGPENDFEIKVGELVNSYGGRILRLKLEGERGWPDDTVLLPGAKAGFLELKAPGNGPSKHQESWLRTLKAFGFHAGCYDNLPSVRRFLERLSHDHS